MTVDLARKTVVSIASMTQINVAYVLTFKAIALEGGVSNSFIVAGNYPTFR